MPPRTDEHASALPAHVTVWLTEAEAAEYLHFHVKYLARRRRRGDGPPAAQPTPGGKVLYRRSDLDDWLAAR